jgi:type IV pilus assembly protein PilE
MRKKRAPTRGFTLMELMITLTVVALLAVVAFPAYQDQLRKSRRAEGKSALLKALQLEERTYTSTGSYTVDLQTLFGAPSATVLSGENPSTGWYSLTAVADPDLAQGVRVTATPVAPFTDPVCGVLTLNAAGVRTSSIGTQALCW